MLKRRTTFILGAGASCEVGLPIGTELIRKIAERLDIRFPDGYTQASGSRLICDAFKRIVSNQDDRNINPYLQAGWRVRDGAALALSIDNFIDAHRDDEKIEKCGKLAISEAILDAEMNSKIYLNSMEAHPKFDHNAIADSWYPKLAQLLTENVGKSNLVSLFQNASFVVFNYDRCLEHYLLHAVQCYYGVPPATAQELVKQADIIHPYGTVGPLEWQEPSGICYGAQVGPEKLVEIAAKLKTFTEQSTDEIARGKISSAIQGADALVFLGFAFHDQNLDLLSPSVPSAVRNVFGTAFHVSNNDCEVIRESVARALQADPRLLRSEIRIDLKCVDLFDQYWRSLRSQ